jgi:hypothetical protein
MNLCMLHSPHANPTVREVREERGRGEKGEGGRNLDFNALLMPL